MPKRRAHGTGSITVEKRAGGRQVWVGAVRVGRRQHQRVLGDKRRSGTDSGMTRAMAERRLREIRAEIEKVSAENAAQSVSDDTVAALGEDYCQEVEAEDCRPQTVQDYRLILRRHLVPFFGDRPLREIEVEHVEAFKKHQINTKELARSTVANHVNLLHAIFKLGMRRKCADGNPVAAAKRMRLKATDKDIRFLEVEEIEAVLRSVPNDTWGKTDTAIYMTAAMTGLRQGELLALRWRDVDWSAGVIRVRENYTRGILGDPKSKHSERAVPMPDRIVAELDRHFKRSNYQQDDHRVFCNPESGTYYVSSTLRSRFYRALKQAEVRQITFHDLRHTYGTRMAAVGVPLRTLQAWMGHADIQTTMIYADYAPDQSAGRRWAEKAFSTSNDAELTAAFDG